MKKTAILIISALMLMPVWAAYSPSVTFSASLVSAFLDGGPYPEARTDVEIALPSWTIGPFSLSIPIRAGAISESGERNGIFVPRRAELSAGVEAGWKGDCAGIFLSYFLGVTDFSTVRAMLRSDTFRLGVEISLTETLSLVLPLYLFSSKEGKGLGAGIGIRVGGEI